MARLFNASYGQMTEFIKALAVAGFTAEQMKVLITNPERTHQWVQWLDEAERSNCDTNLPIHKVFTRDTSLANTLRKNDILTLGELADCTVEELCNIRHISGGRVKVIQEMLAGYGLQLSRNINNGARRVMSYNSAIPSCRRDRIGDKPITAFVQIERNDLADPFPRTQLTVDEVREMSHEGLMEYFSPSDIRNMRSWIATNVR